MFYERQEKDWITLLLQLLSVMVQACCLALIDACIPMTSVFAGVTCAYTNDDEHILDPNSEQEQVHVGSYEVVAAF